MERQSYNGEGYTPNRIPIVSFNDSNTNTVSNGHNGHSNDYTNGNNNGNGHNGNGNNGRYDEDDSFHGNFSASFIAGSYTPNPNRSGLQGVIYSLEEEFTALNDQYRLLLSSIKGNTTSTGGSSPVDIMKEEELVTIIQKLHKKGEQLRSLKSPSK